MSKTAYDYFERTMNWIIGVQDKNKKEVENLNSDKKTVFKFNGFSKPFFKKSEPETKSNTESTAPLIDKESTEPEVKEPTEPEVKEPTEQEVKEPEQEVKESTEPEVKEPEQEVKEPEPEPEVKEPEQEVKESTEPEPIEIKKGTIKEYDERREKEYRTKI
jgi:hypothetical protein